MKHWFVETRVFVFQTFGLESGLWPIEPRQLMGELKMSEGFDVGLEMSGVPSAVHSMLETLNVGASVGLLGIPSKPFEINWDLVIFKGLIIKGIYGREMFETWYKMHHGKLNADGLHCPKERLMCQEQGLAVEAMPYFFLLASPEHWSHSIVWLLERTARN